MAEEEFEPLRIGANVTAAMVARVLNGLRSGELPKAEWTHHAHLAAGAALLDELGLAGAEAEMPGLIRAYNEATGGINNDTEGYHHTLTLFFLRRMEQFLAPHEQDPIEARVTHLLASPFAERDYPFAYYSKELLFSVGARRTWTVPDLQSIHQEIAGAVQRISKLQHSDQALLISN